MDTGSFVVVLGVIVLILGLALMRRGSRGAEEQPSEYDLDDDDPGSALG
jgi:hypothetical protein